MDDENKPVYGWYSKTMAENHTIFYMSKDGTREVEVTTVSHNKDKPSSFWGDEIFLGEVGKYSRQGYQSQKYKMQEEEENRQRRIDSLRNY